MATLPIISPFRSPSYHKERIASKYEKSLLLIVLSLLTASGCEPENLTVLQDHAAGDWQLAKNTNDEVWNASKPSHLISSYLALPPADSAFCGWGETVQIATQSVDVIASNGDKRCNVLLGGGDVFSGNGAENTVVAGSGDDTVFAAPGEHSVFAGSGRDTVALGQGHDFIMGGSGDDVLQSGEGDDEILPGSGNDTVFAGDGSDTVVLQNPCEASSGDILDGGAGFDVLVTPLSLAALQSIGVQVLNFESISVVSETVECDPGCECTASVNPSEPADTVQPFPGPGSIPLTTYEAHLASLASYSPSPSEYFYLGNVGVIHDGGVETSPSFTFSEITAQIAADEGSDDEEALLMGIGDGRVYQVIDNPQGFAPISLMREYLEDVREPEKKARGYIIGKDNRKRSPGFSRAAFKVAFRDPNNTQNPENAHITSCNGVLIAPRVVFAPAHCVFVDGVDSAVKARVYAIAGEGLGSANKIPVPLRYMDRWYTSSNWKGKGSDHKNDWVFIILNDSDVSIPLPPLPVPHSRRYINYSKANLSGYPGSGQNCKDAHLQAGGKCGGWAYQQSSTIRAVYPNMFYHRFDANPGSSGAGIYWYDAATDTRFLAGLNKGHCSNADCNTAIRFRDRHREGMCRVLAKEENKSAYHANPVCE